MKDLFPMDMSMNVAEIKGNAVLCFDEDGVEFQGVIQAKDDTQYAVYGRKSGKPVRKWSRRVSESTDTGSRNCDCQVELDAPGVPVTYDINIVDCDVGDEYKLRRVHGRNNEDVTIRCKSIKFETTQVYRGTRADIEAQRVLGHTMEGENGAVYVGPIEVTAVQSLRKDKPWLL